MLQIQFIAKAAKEGHIAAGSQGGIAECLGVGRRRNMSAESGLRIQIGKVPLNLQTGNGVRIITAPDLRPKAKHAQVKPVAAGRTAFQQNLGTGFKNAPQHIVKTQNIIVCLCTHCHAMAVHIPFHIGNIRAVQHFGHILHDIVPHFLLCQIQQQLMATVKGGETVCQRPVRVGAVQIGIFVDRLRLKPQTELHAHFIDLLCKAGKTLRQFFQVDVIITQTRQIVVAITKPAVIQHEEFTTQLLCPMGKVDQAGLVKVKHTAFPAVVEDRAFLICPIC